MSKMLKVIIVDDEPLARKGLAIRLKAFTDVEVIEQCSNGREAIEAIRAYKPDLIFLDIQMPGLNGFQVIQSLIEQGIKLPQIVFVTAFDQYAIQAFDVHAIDYLLKPADEERLSQTMDKVRSFIANKDNAFHKSQLVEIVSEVTGNNTSDILAELASNKPVNLTKYSDILAIKDAGEVSRVPVKDILWIDAAGDYMCVHTKENTHILRKTMKELEAVLDPNQFIRSHRSTIVNKRYIDKFCSQLNGEYYLVMSTGKELKVSRSYKEKVKLAVHS